MITTTQEVISSDIDKQHQDDQGDASSFSQMPPQNLNSQTQHQHTEQQMSHNLVDAGLSFGMTDQHSAHSLEHAHSLVEHAAHGMLDLSESGSSLEHLAGGGHSHGHSSQSLAGMTSGRVTDTPIEAITANHGRRHLQSIDRTGGMNDLSNQSVRQFSSDERNISGHNGSNGNTPNLVNGPLSVLGGISLAERQNQPMRNLTPGIIDSRGGQNGGSMAGSLTRDGRGSVGLGGGGRGSGQPLNFTQDSSSQNMLESFSSLSSRSRPPSMGSTNQPLNFPYDQASHILGSFSSSRGRPPSVGGPHHNLGTIEEQQHRAQSLPSHMRGLSDLPSHSHQNLMDAHNQQQSIRRDDNSAGHNGQGDLSVFRMDNNNTSQMHSRPGSTLLSEANSHNDAHDLPRTVYSPASISSDRLVSQHSASLIEETISAVVSKLSKSSPDGGGIMPGPLPPNSLMGGLGGLGAARPSSVASHLDHGGDESLADLVNRHHAHGLHMLSDRASQHLSGLMDENSMNQSPGHSHGRELEKTHPCLTCLKLFRSKQQLAQHSLVHTGIRKHICSFCDRAFKQLSHLQQHVRIHTGERKYVCKFCERGFKQMSHLQKHVRIHTGERKYVCSICEKGFKQLSHLQQHFRIHTDERKYICSCCEKGFRQLSHLQQHFRIHTGERKYVCQICNRAFKQMTHLQQHHRIHTGERKYVCQICSRAFKQMTHLQQHHVIHTGERKYVCHVCNKAFKQMTHLQQHHRIHTGERKYVCQVCSRAFKQLTHLQKHHVIHTGERKYVCQCCDRAFKQLTHLQQHYRIHTGEKPYQCKFENCERAFAQLSNLQHHMRNHDDQVKKEATRVHKCQICHRCYTNESSLKSHILKMHVHTKPLDQQGAIPGKKKHHRKNKDLYGATPSMVPTSSSSDGGFTEDTPEMKASTSQTRSLTSDDDDEADDDEIIFVDEKMGPSRGDNFGGVAGNLGVQGQMLQGQGDKGHDFNHQSPFSGLGNFSRGTDPLALLASANRFSLQENMISGLSGALNSFSDQLAFRDAALLNSRFNDLRGISQGASFDERFSSNSFNQQHRDRDGGFNSLNDMSSRGNAGNSNSSSDGSSDDGCNDNMQAHNGSSNDNRNQIPAHNQGMLRGSGIGGLGGGLSGMMHDAGQGSLGNLLKQIKQEPLDYFPTTCPGGDQFGGMGVTSGRGFLSPQHILNSHLRGQLPSLNVPLIRDHFTHSQMLPHFSSSPGPSSTSSTPISNIPPSSTPSTSLPSSTPSSLVSLPHPLPHMSLYHQSHFSTSQRMATHHPSPSSTPSSQMSGGTNLPSNLSSQGGRSPLEQEDLRCFSPLRN